MRRPLDWRYARNKLTPSGLSEEQWAYQRGADNLQQPSTLLKGGIMPRKPSWTTEEDAIVLRMYPTAVAKLLTHRTRGSIAQHRFLLQHPQKEGSWKNWTAEEDAILRRLWPTPSHVRELLPLFPNRNAIQLRS